MNCHEFAARCRKCKIRTVAKLGDGQERRVIKFHSRRSTYVSMARDMGVAVDDVRQAVGHGSPAMTEHYNQSQAAARRVAAVMPGLE